MLCLLPVRAHETPCGDVPVLIGSSPSYEPTSGGSCFLLRDSDGGFRLVFFYSSSGHARVPDMCLQGFTVIVSDLIWSVPKINWFHPVTTLQRGLSGVERRPGLGQAKPTVSGQHCCTFMFKCRFIFILCVHAVAALPRSSVSFWRGTELAKNFAGRVSLLSRQ